MTGLIMKLIFTPFLLLATNYFLGFNYTTTQSVLVGFIIAVVGHMMEVLVLKRGTLWISTVSDLVVAFAIIYLSQFFFANVIVTLSDALITALILAVIEYLQHSILIKTGKTKKSNE